MLVCNMWMCTMYTYTYYTQALMFTYSLICLPIYVCTVYTVHTYMYEGAVSSDAVPGEL